MIKKQIYRNQIGFKEITEYTHWVLQNSKKEFFSKFVFEHGYKGMKFIKEIELATSWKNKKLALKWIKENDSMGYSMAKLVKIKISNQTIYEIPE